MNSMLEAECLLGAIPTTTHIMVIDDDPLICESIAMVLENAGMEVSSFNSWTQAAKDFCLQKAHLVLLDLYIGQLNGLVVLEELLTLCPAMPVLMISGQASCDDALAAVRAGAYDFFEKPIRSERLLVSVRNAVSWSQLQEDAVRQIIPIANAPAMRRFLDALRKVAPSDSTVLIQGESGTGKDLTAQLVHKLSGRSGEALVFLNCAALPSELIESELFGHTRGAFTGAVAEQQGKIMQAHKGTLFLDEIGDLPLAAQSKLLRFLETGELQRVGSASSSKADVRVLAATHRDLAAMCAQGSFREDLLYRLNVLPLRVPALRERTEDIPALLDYFAQEGARRLGVFPPRFSEAVFAELSAASWPGNIRELRNLVERLLHFYPGKLIELEQLGLLQRPAQPKAASSTEEAELAALAAELFTPCNPADARDRFEKAYLEYHLAKHAQSVQQTAASLAILPNNLSRRLRQLGIHRD